MPISTTTVNLLQTVLDELEAHLPALLAAAGLPAVASWCYGQRELVAVTNSPQVEVDLASYPQSGGFADTTRRENQIVVIAQLAAPDEDTLHRYLIGYADCIVACLEANISVPGRGGSPIVPVVTDVDPTPSGRHGNALWRAVFVSATLLAIHTRGAV